VTEVARRHPTLKIIAAHLAGPGYMEAIDAARQVDNVWVDTCSSHALDDKVRAAVRLLGAGRVLFGSGMMQGNGFMQKAVIMEADIAEREREMILYENARALFRLSG
jgi:predicted TIM-barrel fold metal-dependent hydrolase